MNFKSSATRPVGAVPSKTFTNFKYIITSKSRFASANCGNIMGKYQGDKSKSSGSTAKPPEVPTTSMEPVVFPLIKQAHIPTVLPLYTTILSRSLEDGVGMEDLDQIQQDLEKLLSTCSVRNRMLRSQVESIDRVEERKEKRGKPSDKPSAKRKRADDKPKHKDARNIARILKSKQLPSNSYDVPKVIIPRHDTSDRFWLSVEPYCQEVSKDNVHFLDEIIQECSQTIDVKIPEIGEHYALEWADHSIQSEQTNGNSKPIKRSYSNDANIDTFQSPLTQRLIDSLIEDKLIKQIPFDKVKDGDCPIKSNMRSGLCLDRRLRKELVEQGILDMNDLPKSFPPEDEILLEIKKCEQELGIVNKHNIGQLNKLRTVVARDLRKQAVKSALDKVDKQIMSLTGLETDAPNIIKQQILLHRELTDYSLLTNE